MRASTYVGRVGALAVALGVGAAVATGHGVASADTTTDPAKPTSQESAAPGDADKPKENSQPSEASPATKPSGIRTTIGNGRSTLRATVRDGLDKLFNPPRRAAGSGRKATTGADPATVEEPPATADTSANDSRRHQRSRTSTPLPSIAETVAPPSTVKLNDQRTVHTFTVPRPQTSPVVDANLVSKAAVNTTTVTMPGPSEGPTAPAEKVAVRGAATESPAVPPFSVTSVVNNLLAAVGLTPIAGTSPTAPDSSPLSWVMLAVARREFGILGNTAATRGARTAAPLTTTDVSQAAVAAAPSTTFINWVTGPVSPNATPGRFSVAGTDLGIMWDNGETGPARQVLIAFGDTFSQPGMTGEWRSNILFRSADRILSDTNGLYVADPQFGDIFAGSPVLVDRPNFSRQLVYGIPGTIGLFGIPQLFGSEVTMIPTAGISVPGAGVGGATRQYMNVMSVRNWGPAGMWTTNYSAIAYSDDNGETWTIDENTIRSAGFLRTFGHPYEFGNENFQMGAFVRPPEGSPDAEAGYVYSFGTPAGRFGPAYVSRVNENEIQDLSAYEYWDGEGWVQGDPSAAVPVFAGEKTPFSGLISLANNLLGLFGIPVIIPSGDASEMSVQYNEYLDQYVVLYSDGNANVVMRTASRPEGPWSDPVVLATSTEYPGLYAPMIHPWSSTGYLLDDNGNPEDPKYLYWNLSQWDQYNVRLMRTDLSTIQV